MPNILRNDLKIEGPNVQQVLDAIGFMKPSTWEELNEIVLIDLYRLGHEFNCEWPTPYGGYQDGDVFEVTDNKASFKFYTANQRAQQVIWALSEHFPGHKFTITSNDLINGLIAGEVVEGGKQTVFVQVHCHEDLIPEVWFNYPIEEDEELATKPCPVPDCSILFAPPTDFKEQARRDASVFHAEEAE